MIFVKEMIGNKSRNNFHNMSKEYNKNKKVQIRLYPHSDRYKRVEYRIDPSELNWFQKILGNFWQPIYQFVYIGGDPDDRNFIPLLDKPGTIDRYKDIFKTIKDIEDFEQEQLEKYHNSLKKYCECKCDGIEY